MIFILNPIQLKKLNLLLSPWLFLPKWLAAVGTIHPPHVPVSSIAAAQQLGHKQYQEVERQKEIVYLRSVGFQE